MPTGVCGINCDVCKLRLAGVCSSCGSGKSREAQKKLEAQRQIFGSTCTVLACAYMNNLDYCLRDCNSFPCDNFASGPYPFAHGFLNMQKRRREQRPPALNHNSIPVQVPPEYWDILKQRDINELCNFTLAEPHGSGGLTFCFLQENIFLDIENRCIRRLENNRREKTDDPLLELIILVYFINVRSLCPVGKDIIGVGDLRESHFFKAPPHELKLGHLSERYGTDPEGFRAAAEYLKGKPVNMADMAYMFLPFPRVPLYYLFWKGDEEFPPRFSLLFDRSVEECFAADAIWGLVNRVSLELLRGPRIRVRKNTDYQ